MKKFAIAVLMVLGATFGAKAQVSKNALGLRLGSNSGFGTEVSYQRGLAKNTRLELDLGWRDTKNTTAIKLVGTYQWVNKIEGGLNWYVGVGAGVNNYSAKGKTSSTSVLAAGDIGLEYNFKAPIQISLDYRPEYYFTKYNDFNQFGNDIALSVRYRF